MAEFNSLGILSARSNHNLEALGFNLNSARSGILTNRSTVRMADALISDIENRNKPTNQLHEIRMKERSMMRNQKKKLASEIDRHVERKRLSSAYTQSRYELLETLKEDNSKTSSRENNPLSSRFRYVHYSKDQVVISKAISRASSSASENSLQEGEVSTSIENTFFVPPLVELCARKIAKNFSKKLNFDGVPPELKHIISKKLSVKLPLQISVPLIDDDDYWKKCCFMRWSLGQLGTYCNKKGIELLQEESNTAVQDIMIKGSFKNRSKKKTYRLKDNRKSSNSPKTWKQVYLEINFDEFMESIQPQKTMLQELNVIHSQPNPEEPMCMKNSELNTLRDLYKVKETINETKLAKEQFEKEMQNKRSNSTVALEEKAVNDTLDQTLKREENEEEEEEFTTHNCLHSHLMKPNVNYFVLHCKTLNKDDLESYPIEKYKAKLQDLFDGIQSRNTSRLKKITNSDDIFTFYESAVQKRDQRKQRTDDRKLQTWLNSYRNELAEQDLPDDVRDMFDFIIAKNREHLRELCNLSKDYITELNIKGLKEHVDLYDMFSLLTNVEKLKMEYSARNVGMTFDMNLLGMRKQDCLMLAQVLSDPNVSSNLKVLILSENMIDDELTKIIASGTLKSQVTHLDLSHNRIGVEGASALAALLKRNTKLKKLVLADNEIKSEGALTISLSLQVNSNLTDLNLSLNKIRDAGAVAILHSNCTSLTNLSLSNNSLMGETGNTIIEKLNHIIKTGEIVLPKYIDLSGNFIEEYATSLIRDMLPSCPQIEHID
ncbi:hypothetical protein ABK040_013125 [Willaertia magna]